MENERTCDEQFSSCSETPLSLKRGLNFQFANFLKENHEIGFSLIIKIGEHDQPKKSEIIHFSVLIFIDGL